MLKPDRDQLAKFLQSASRPPAALGLLITRSCQLQCGYCRVARRREAATPESLREAVDFLLRSPSRELALEFSGGEPLLRFDLLCGAVKHCLSRLGPERSCLFTVVTNGILLDSARLDWLVKHKVRVRLGMDGSVPERGLWRGCADGDSRHAAVLRNFAGLRVSGADYAVNLLVAPEGAKRAFQELDALARLGTPRLRVACDCSACWEEDDLSALLSGLEHFTNASAAGDYGAVPPQLDDDGGSPVFLRDRLLADCDGEVYMASALLLENGFPLARRELLLGRAHQLACPEDALPDPRERMARWLRVCQDQKEKRVFLSSLAAGLALRGFFSSHAPGEGG